MKKFALFISLTGNDSNTGDINAPLKTLKKAIEKASVIRNDYDEIYIYVREGEYEITDTVELTKETTKNGKARIIITSYNNENVIFSGGKRIPAKDLKPVEDEDNGRIKKEVKDKILCVDLKKYGITEFGEIRIRIRGSVYDIRSAELELFVDDDEANRARFPKTEKRIKIEKNDILRKFVTTGHNYFPATDDPYGEKEDVTDKCAILKYNFPEADRWEKAHDAYFFYNTTFDFTIPVNIDTKKKELQLKEGIGVGSGNYTLSYRIVNLLEELDCENEYYIDSETLMLFYYPKKDFNENTKLRVSYLKTPMFAIEDAKEIEINGITMECMRGMAVYSEGSHHTDIKNCIFRNIGMVAVSFGTGYKDVVNGVHDGDLIPEKRKIGSLKAQTHKNPLTFRNGGYNNTVMNCEIYNIGCGGIVLDGGNRFDLTRGDNRIVGCDIHDYNRLEKTYRPGVHVFGCGNTVSFCKIYNSPQMAIELNGNENTVEHCEIFNCCTDSYDNGAIYCGSRFASRNTAGTIFRNNYFHDNGSEKCTKNEVNAPFRSETYHLYLDGHGGTTMTGNIFEGGDVLEAIFINSDAFYDKVIGNIFIDVNGVMHREMGVDYSFDPYTWFGFNEEQQKIWKEKYPHFETYKDMKSIPDAGHEIIDNIHIGKGTIVRTSLNVFKYENNVHYDEMPKNLR